MAPNFNLEESEETALAQLDNPIEILELSPEELEDLQMNIEGEDDSINPDLPEKFIEVVQARAIRTKQTIEPTFPDSGLDAFINEKARAFHLTRVVQIQGGEDFKVDPEVIEGLARVVDNDEEPSLEGVYTKEELEALKPDEGEETTEVKLHNQEELQAAHTGRFAFKLGGKQYNG